MSVSYSSKLLTLLNRIKGINFAEAKELHPNRNIISYYYRGYLYMVDHVFHWESDNYRFMKVKPISVKHKGKVLGTLTNKDLNFENVNRIVVSGYYV